jgi:hypothetical protein
LIRTDQIEAYYSLVLVKHDKSALSPRRNGMSIILGRVTKS